MKVKKIARLTTLSHTKYFFFLKKRPKSTSFARISPKPLRGRRRGPPPRRSPPPRPPSSGGGCRTWRPRGGGRRSGGRCVKKTLKRKKVDGHAKNVPMTPMPLWTYACGLAVKLWRIAFDGGLGVQKFLNAPKTYVYLGASSEGAACLLEACCV